MSGTEIADQIMEEFNRRLNSEEYSRVECFRWLGNTIRELKEQYKSNKQNG
jgi:hypothetical protein